MSITRQCWSVSIIPRPGHCSNSSLNGSASSSNTLTRSTCLRNDLNSLKNEVRIAFNMIFHRCPLTGIDFANILYCTIDIFVDFWHAQWRYSFNNTRNKVKARKKVPCALMWWVGGARYIALLQSRLIVCSLCNPCPKACWRTISVCQWSSCARRAMPWRVWRKTTATRTVTSSSFNSTCDAPVCNVSVALTISVHDCWHLAIRTQMVLV